MGKALQDFHQSKGVNFRLNVRPASFEGEENVKRVHLSDGTTLDADLVILGTGIHPNVGFVGGLGVSSTNGGIETDAFLRTK